MDSLTAYHRRPARTISVRHRSLPAALHGAAVATGWANRPTPRCAADGSPINLGMILGGETILWGEGATE